MKVQSGHTVQLSNFNSEEHDHVATEELFNLVKDSKNITPADIGPLLARKADINAQDEYGWTPLMYLAWNGHEDAASFLLNQSKPDVNIKNKGGMTALMLASWHGKTRIVQALINKKRAVIDPEEDGDMSALMLASWAGRRDTVELLLNNGAQVYRKYKDGRSALMFASWGGHLETVKLLKDTGGDIHDRNKAGKNALMLALENEQQHVSDYLSSLGLTVNPDATEYHSTVTELMKAAWKGNLKEVKEILGRQPKPEINGRSIDGRTALMWAAWAGRLDVVKVLVDNGADVNAKDKDTRSVLMWAARNGKTEVVNYLKNVCYADNTCRTDDGFNASMFASAFGHKDLALNLAA